MKFKKKILVLVLVAFIGAMIPAEGKATTPPNAPMHAIMWWVKLDKWLGDKFGYQTFY